MIAPADHPWHRGVWFSWKYLSGVNYWEFPQDRPNQPDGKTAVITPPSVQVGESKVTIQLKLAYSKGQAVLAEEREWISVRHVPADPCGPELWAIPAGRPVKHIVGSWPFRRGYWS
jgi:hypothetical protein